MSVRKRRSYDVEFKKNAVLLCDEEGRTVAGVAESLEIPKGLLYRWRRELTAHKEIAFPDRGKEGFNRRATRDKRASKTAPRC